jgi:hypothetical protein
LADSHLRVQCDDGSVCPTMPSSKAVC